MLYLSRITVTTAGTRKPLATVRTPATWVNVQNTPTNSGSVFLGDVNVAAATPGVTITPGSAFFCPQETVPTPYDLANMYVDASVNGTTVDILYHRR
jgi:hypothetical protein